MPSRRLFVDTGFLVARFDASDQYHQIARSFDADLTGCQELDD